MDIFETKRMWFDGWIICRWQTMNRNWVQNQNGWFINRKVKTVLFEVCIDFGGLDNNFLFCTIWLRVTGIPISYRSWVDNTLLARSHHYDFFINHILQQFIKLTKRFDFMDGNDMSAVFLSTLFVIYNCTVVLFWYAWGFLSATDIF